MIKKLLFVTAVATSALGVATLARALDVAPTTPSTQLNQTLPTVPRDAAAPATPPSGFNNTHPVAGLPGYVFVAPAWQRTGDANSSADPASRNSFDNHGWHSRMDTHTDGNRQ